MGVIFLSALGTAPRDYALRRSFPVRMLRQAGVELFHELCFVVAGVGDFEETFVRFAEAASPAFPFAAGRVLILTALFRLRPT